MQSQEQIYDMLVEKDDITWKSILYDLVKTEQLDPWNIDISVLVQKYIQRIKELKEVNLSLSGKVLLAAALLLHIQSQKLLGADLTAFDQLIATTGTDGDDFYASLENESRPIIVAGEETPVLTPRTPQPRSRKVTIQDLVKALEQALEVKHRRLVKQEAIQLRLNYPENSFDINISIKNVHKKILEYLIEQGKGMITFSTLTPNPTRHERVHTLIPLLHLSNERELDLHQPKPFHDIAITLTKKTMEASP